MDTAALLLSFTEGILSFISPCVLPMVPVYMAYLAGSARSMYTDTDKRALYRNAAGFLLGFILVVFVIGFLFSSFASFIRGGGTVFRRVTGSVVVILGVLFLLSNRVPFFNGEKRFSFQMNCPSFFKSMVFG